jgi:hypothetical protein
MTVKAARMASHPARPGRQKASRTTAVIAGHDGDGRGLGGDKDGPVVASEDQTLFEGQRLADAANTANPVIRVSAFSPAEISVRWRPSTARIWPVANSVFRARLVFHDMGRRHGWPYYPGRGPGRPRRHVPPDIPAFGQCCPRQDSPGGSRRQGGSDGDPPVTVAALGRRGSLLHRAIIIYA